MKKLQVVVGAQYGSEAKGHVTQRLAERAIKEGSVQVIRVAGPNAGHTGYDKDGNPWAFRQVPVAAVVNGPAILGIAAGSEIDPDVLLDEFDQATKAGLMDAKMLWVHGEATLIDPQHKDEEAMGRITDKIGSTGKGIGAARAQRIWRRAMRVCDDEKFVDALADRGIPIAHAEHNVGAMVRNSETVIIEGTQGFGLGLHAGHYPQCTSSDCRAVDFMAMAGVHPWQFDETEVWAVARVFPIRVAGNSGPLKDETSWEALGLSEERTTVTKKVRRVGGEDWDLVRRAVIANGGAPTVRLALTMVDQKFPAVKGVNLNSLIHDGPVRSFIKQVEREAGARVALATSGPNTATWMEAL